MHVIHLQVDEPRCAVEAGKVEEDGLLEHAHGRLVDN